MRKAFQKIHLWLSLPFGIFITLICFSGAMLVFEKEVMEMSNPQLYYVERVGERTLKLEELAERVNAVLPDDVHVTGITVFSDPKRTYQVSLSKPRRASMYIDQYTGEITGRYERSSFFTTMFKMHRWMMGSARAEDGSMGFGKLLVGVSTLMFVFVLISGVVIWWPRSLSALKHRLTIKCSKGWRRFWYDLHVAGGIYALVLLLAMALTGLTWSFQWYRNGFYSVFGVEQIQGKAQGQQMQRSKSGDGTIGNNREMSYLHWQKVYEDVASQVPEHKQIAIYQGVANVSFDQYGNQRASDKYSFDTHSGEITNVSLYKDNPDSSKIRGWIYSVHVGSWGGLPARILAFCVALFGASLPITGYYLWIKRKLQSRKCRESNKGNII